jgi:SecD/SecF fusion protein
MQASNTVKIVLIVAAIAFALYLLYPTYQLNKMTEAEIKQQEIVDPKSMENLRSKSINLGLDLQGGMHVILEVDVKELLLQLASVKDAQLTQTLEATVSQIQDTDEDFISVFNSKLKEAGINIVRYYGTRQLNDEDKVIEFLRDNADEAIDRALQILRNRIDQYGVREPVIQKQGSNRIIVALAGIKDPTQARNLIKQSGKLEFRLLKDQEAYIAVAEKINRFIQSKVSPLDTLSQDEGEDTGTATDDSTISLDDLFSGSTQEQDTAQTGDQVVADSMAIFEENMFFVHPQRNQSILVPTDKREKFKQVIAMEQVEKILDEEAGDAEFLWSSKPDLNGAFYEVFLVNRRSELGGETIVDTRPAPGSLSDPGSIGKFEVSLTLNDDGSQVFSRVTGANKGKRLAIVLDGNVYLAPTIQVRISDGRSRITGLETMEEANQLSIILKAGAFPTPVRIEEERTVGPSLGKDSIEKGSQSAIIGLIIVALFMIVYYKFSGTLADLALTLNVVFIMAVMASLNATLTMPGIAGIILTIGMAVDANVLIFERIREEKRRGKTIRTAIDQGYSNALSAIIDANVTTGIAGVVLFTFGSGPIKGFATTLLIGIAASMFTAVIVTRVIFNYVLEKWTIKELSI